ncbi:hypothetical protein [Anaerosalibacter sp. Marseille-P3206]|uniref:hypothetical protein n=1 Tax=Anaerosalibacter sp. Marseille-P3206 TaxID=1871005 RepID=UPI000984DAC1|nr:hypothetical protein [Anaerosalibacter sp. Marseille-P3206]
MKLRIVPKGQVKRAYESPHEKSKFDLKGEMKIDGIDKVPQELFLIIKETLNFIEKVNEEDNNEDK